MATPDRGTRSHQLHNPAVDVGALNWIYIQLSHANRVFRISGSGMFCFGCMASLRVLGHESQDVFSAGVHTESFEG